MADIETDATRLAMLQAVGGETITCPGGTFVAVYEAPFAGVGDSLADVTTNAPRFICRTSDLTRCAVALGQSLSRASGAVFTLVAPPEHDGTGISTLQVHTA